MKWSWKIGSVAGIKVYVHSTFLILLGWIAVSHWTADHSYLAVAEGVGFILAIFSCVVAHELGHALAAQQYGITTRDITLLPIGGVARLERMPDKPWEEFVVALAGPLVNVVIAAALFIGLKLGGWLVAADSLSVTGGPFLVRLLAVNVFLVVFNLLPAFPMDGGRVLRAILAARMEYTKATQIAANIGQSMALMFLFLGMLTNPFLIFIALFVWIGAAQEASMVQVRSAIAGIPVRQAMITNFHTVRPTDKLLHAVDLTLAGNQTDFPVIDHGRLAGILTQAGMLETLANQGADATIRDAMQSNIQTADSRDMLETALQRINECDCRVMPVTREGELVGLLTMDNIGEFLRVQAALGRGHSRATPLWDSNSVAALNVKKPGSM